MNRISKNIKKYSSFVKGYLMGQMAYRMSFITMLIGNLFYISVIYFLWKAIFAGVNQTVINGMNFYDTILYLVIALVMSNIFETNIVGSMGSNYMTGQVSLDLVRPMDYQLMWYLYSMAHYISVFIVEMVPAYAILYFMFNDNMKMGINILFFIISLFCATMTYFCIDFFVGTLCFYAQSVWGLNIAKNVIVAVLSGAVIPLAFYPKEIYNVLIHLPFHTIYYTPIKILINENYRVGNYVSMIVEQLLWFAVIFSISRLFWTISKKKVMVNGG